MIKKKSSAVLRRLDDNNQRQGGKGRLERTTFTSYEQTILTEVVAPEDIHVTFNGTFPSRFHGLMGVFRKLIFLVVGGEQTLAAWTALSRN